ncbi:MAG: tRNA (adenosine(37)-N6)-threonylcarbamoyltransferase complex transferase subunit TsaD [Dehalococcoidia bacterium]|nr:tRNA (adenosine(37)-N6)-threonylcarbamoyltransferase complex transferase subunit TsaD [Dehalococcoidia bacterium]
MLILGIETSCDETAVAVVGDNGLMLSNTVATQVEVHARYGGIVPEVASRQHVLAMGPVVRKAVADAGVSWADIDAVAVTHGPGLAGSLIVGVNAAKGIAASLGKPLVGVNHLEGHIYGAWVQHPPQPMGAHKATPGASGSARVDFGIEPGFPLMCLIVSGGHTELVLMLGHPDNAAGSANAFSLKGETRDDAAGEAFDKAARVLGLPYPGGPEIQRLAENAPTTERFTRPYVRGSDDFSFSGLKSALIRRAREVGVYPAPEGGVDRQTVAALAKAFQSAVVDVLVRKTLEAAERHDCRGIVVAGGVAANKALRMKFVAESPLPVAVPHPSLCTDNGAMIAMSGMYRFKAGMVSDFSLDVDPGLRIGQ